MTAGSERVNAEFSHCTCNAIFISFFLQLFSCFVAFTRSVTFKSLYLGENRVVCGRNKLSIVTKVSLLNGYLLLGLKLSSCNFNSRTLESECYVKLFILIVS